MLAQVDSLSPRLSAEQKTRLHELERIVERSLTSFLECGRALLAVRDEGLYVEYGNFETYCRQRWGLSAHRGLAIVRATQVAENLLDGPGAPDGDAPLPADLPESLMRPLTKLAPELQSECWRLASSITERPTHHIVSRIVRTVQSAIDAGIGTSREVKRQEKDIFLPSLLKLAGGESFSAQIVVYRIEDLERARRCWTACLELGRKCEALVAELEHRFPDLLSS
jgi:hypothetical protein